MNKKAIWVIIGLMGAAVIGVVCLQLGLIFTAIRVNEDKFEKDVFEALNTVVKRIEKEEQRDAFGNYANGFVTSYLESEISSMANQPAIEINFAQHTIRTLGTDRMDPDQVSTILSNECQCSRCVAERDQIYRKLFAYYQQDMHGIPIAERIKLPYLKALLKRELANRGIDIPYTYGVYSKQSNSFVIVDDHYVVEEANPQEIAPGYQNIYNSNFQVHLFPEDMPSSPGLLMVHFPTKASYVWSSNIPNLIGFILFTSIIFYCFAYTIRVIFTQKKLSEMKNDFINNMTHEFKTPIATISLASDSITSPIISGNPEKVRRFANIIKQENIRMNNQVEKVLQMAVIEKQDFSLKFTDINLHEVIERAVENIGLQVEKREGVVKAVFDATNPIISGDLTHVSNIINNLLDNANKYSPDHPEITVYTRNIAGGVEVTVEDKGMGMSKEARKHIFDKFYRVHTGNLHDVKGFGLGLSYVKAMMTAHKGTIDVKSELGKGSSFILFFQHKIDNK